MPLYPRAVYTKGGGELTLNFLTSLRNSAVTKL